MHASFDIGGLVGRIMLLSAGFLLNSEKILTKTSFSGSITLEYSETRVCCCIINAVGEAVTVCDAVY